jgi:membrane glycosyltransferase
MSPSPNILRGQALRRRFFLASVVFLLVILVAVPMGRMLSHSGWNIPKAVFFALFILLLIQVVFSSVVAVAGWRLLERGEEPSPMSNAAPQPDMALPATAIVMPVYNEDVNRVFQGLRFMNQSLQKTGRAGAFDFFILSDTSETNCWIAEEKAWFELCKETQGFGRFFYRRRRVRLHHKSGNIADFCRRWGAIYRYMIVLDADSIMTGETFVQLVALMEQRPWAGIIQTSTRPILGQSLFQRIDQFAAFAYRPLFVAGMSMWQLGDATFWGHNAIVRLKPFMRHCAMPELPEVGPLGRQILSHDTIEAALMQRSGYEVWQTQDAEGSYEQGPPHLPASLQRDRRWCHGNLQHVWFLFERGLKTVSRFNILTGILAYVNSPIWLLSMVLGVVLAARQNGGATGLHGGGPNPVAVSGILYVFVMGMLLLPKFLGAVLVMQSPEKLRLFGSRAKVAMNVAAETLHSMLLAPILMLFHTWFVLASCCGAKVNWGPQTRGDERGRGWHAWMGILGVATVLALAATDIVMKEDPSLLPWLAPVLAGPILAVPFAYTTASGRLGLRARAARWFVTPEEVEPPVEWEKMDEPFIQPPHPFFRARQYAADYGLLQAVLDPVVNANHVSLLRQRTDAGSRTREYMALLADRLLLDGPFSLTPAEKRTLLWDADAMLAMHQKLWGSPASHLHEWWQAAFRHYVETSALSTRRTVSV